ncbi:hypothetical protein JCM19294_1982 [Nonlabens tegetincola]|uniref:Uncharacterized protein n=1 Tax=Nonlabens tegetincola TaxID=323273 RepID=A0A090Q066_9FLAO|nr:hypothetical protein JCM19294_1982 [Nonlabens tegetincola]
MVNPVQDCKKWYGVINHPNQPELASERIWDGINKIIGFD